MRRIAYTGRRALCSASPLANTFPGVEGEMPFTSSLALHDPEVDATIPCFRVVDESGAPIKGAEDLCEAMGKKMVTGLYTTMVRLNAMDNILYDAQRQGRISFYMTSFGEEAAVVGSAAAFDTSDTMFGQYREAGALMHRGFTYQEFIDQCFSNIGDPAKGRQMPMHFGSAALNFQTISSPLATQIPQAAGAAYALKVQATAAGKEATEQCVACYFGEGAASEGDFHSAMNFAATLECPVVFICRNNGYAISTPAREQYRGDGIIGRAAGYGMASIRVDGNDIFAVHAATAAARAFAVEHSRPVMVEVMAYRVGHHSTSDDSTRYRTVEEIQTWRKERCPIRRTRAALEARGWWDEDREQALRDGERTKVLEALLEGETKEKPALLEALFDDVYDELPPHLVAQRAELEAHLAKYPDQYALEEH